MMGITLTGRSEEQNILKAFYGSKRAEFLAVYGRRRVGKTFLIKSYFDSQSCIFLKVTGVQQGELQEQISRFMKAIGDAFYRGSELKEPTDWYGVFDVLVDAINKMVPKNKKVVLFFDEFPWMVTPRSKLLSVLEYYWNQYWVDDQRIKLIICGSSASWIIRKIINNRGGLHNRITYKMRLQPFSLNETKAYLHSKGVKVNNKQVTQLYMVTGGIPYYLASAKKGLSVMQQIEMLAFSKNSILFTEFDNLFSSLFDDAEPYVELIRIIAKHRDGIGQEDLISASKFASRGGRASDKLTELEEAGFIMSFIPHYHKKRGTYYKVIDEYTLFYLKWIEPVRNTLQRRALEKGYWESEYNSPTWLSWAGYAFEALCYKHISQIRKKLEISPSAIANAWRYVPTAKATDDGAQIDILFDRKDDAITLCEIKYTDKPFTIDKAYAKSLLNKRDVFARRTKTKKQLFIAMISASGLKDTLYVDDFIDGLVTIDDLFVEI